MADTTRRASPPLPDRKKVTGVYSRLVAGKPAADGTPAKPTKIFLYVEEDDRGGLTAWLVGKNRLPAGEAKALSRETLAKFQAEARLWDEEVGPKLRSLEKTLARADRYRRLNQGFSAEYEFGNALKMDPKNVRALAGLGICWLERGEAEKIKPLVRKLAAMPEAFESRYARSLLGLAQALEGRGLDAEARMLRTPASDPGSGPGPKA